jgi:hypothetical protein
MLADAGSCGHLESTSDKRLLLGRETSGCYISPREQGYTTKTAMSPNEEVSNVTTEAHRYYWIFGGGKIPVLVIA